MQDPRQTVACRAGGMGQMGQMRDRAARGKSRCSEGRRVEHEVATACGSCARGF